MHRQILTKNYHDNDVSVEENDLPELSQAEVTRYSRHLILPEVGIDGQKKLKKAKVLVIGAGGLGSPISLYLAAAGVGTIGLVDYDIVDETNLQRQVLYSTKEVGKPKLQVAKKKLLALNPNMTVNIHEEQLNSSNALEIIREYDIVVDGTDNFPTRYLVNDACVLLGKPNVYGSIFRFEGQLSVFHVGKGPCYRCLYPEPPPPGLVPSCAEGGVLGVLPGIIGCLQANEVIKLILGMGKPMIGRLLLFDALEMTFRELKLRKNPNCVACGANPKITKLIDYEAFCGLKRGEEESITTGFEITPEELSRLLQEGQPLQLIDVREPHERRISKIEPSILIPLRMIVDQAKALDKDRLTVVYCRSGARSAQAAHVLKGLGFKRVKNLAGGVNEWVKKIDPSQPAY